MSQSSLSISDIYPTKEAVQDILPVSLCGTNLEELMKVVSMSVDEKCGLVRFGVIRLISQSVRQRDLASVFLELSSS